MLHLASVEEKVFVVSAACYETELETLITDRIPSVKDVPIELARRRAAWRKAKSELLESEDKARRGAAPAEEMDESLEATIRDDLMARFARSYGHKIFVHMLPSDTILARVYRELTRNLPTSAERQISLGANDCQGG